MKTKINTFGKILSEMLTSALEEEILAAIEDEKVSQSTFNGMLKKWVNTTNGGKPVDTLAFDYKKLKGKKSTEYSGSTTYLSGQWTPTLSKASMSRMSEQGFSGLGLIVQPFTYHYLGSKYLNGFDSIGIDNGMFTKAGRENFSWEMYEKMIKMAIAQFHRGLIDLNFFTVPDQPFDWKATLQKFAAHKSEVQRLRSYGAPVAICIQNGATVDDVPFSDVDVIFIGGDDKWKVGDEAKAICDKAKSQGLEIHMGRVNNPKRLNTASRWGTHTADGTYLMHELAKSLHDIETKNPQNRGESQEDYFKRLKRILHGTHSETDLHPDNPGGHATEPEIVNGFIDYVIDIQDSNHYRRRYDAIADMARDHRPLNRSVIGEYDRFLPSVPGLPHGEDVVEFDSAGNVIMGRDNRPVRRRELEDMFNISPPHRDMPEGIPFDPKDPSVYMSYINRYIARMRKGGVLPH